MMQPQPQPQAQIPSGTPPIAPQGNPQAAPTIAPQHDKPSGRAGQSYNPQILQHIEQHLAQLPDQQKAFVVQYMTPELATVLGIIIGQEAYDYFNQFADPKKMLVVQPRPEQPNAAPQAGQAPQGAPADGQPPASSGGPAQAAPQPQSKANTTAPSIMGV